MGPRQPEYLSYPCLLARKRHKPSRVAVAFSTTRLVIFTNRNSFSKNTSHPPSYILLFLSTSAASICLRICTLLFLCILYLPGGSSSWLALQTMDSAALLVSLPNAEQKAPSMAAPLSAELLQYRLARTPTLRRFNRNRNVISPQAQEKSIFHDKNTPSLPRAELRPASDLLNHATTVEEPHSSSIRIARRRPAPKLYSTLSQPTSESISTKQPRTFVSSQNGLGESLSRTTVSEFQEKPPDLSPASSDEADGLTLNEAIREAAIRSQVKHIGKVQEKIRSPDVKEGQVASSRSHVSETQLSPNQAEKRRLKRPTKRTPLPSAPSSILQQTVHEEATSSRQFSIPDEERPPKAKKRSRARRLPDDELELAEERQQAHEAPPMCKLNSEEYMPPTVQGTLRLKWSKPNLQNYPDE